MMFSARRSASSTALVAPAAGALAAAGHSPRTNGRRGAAAVAATTLLLAASTFTNAAQAQEVEPELQDISVVCPPSTPEWGNYSDLSVARSPKEIRCLTAYRLTRGTTDTTFSPLASVSRQQLVTFLFRLSDALNHPVVTRDRPAFNDLGADIDTEQQFAVAAMAHAGVVGGYPDGTFRPDEPVTRGQAAALLVRFQDWVSDGRAPLPAPAEGRAVFADTTGYYAEEAARLYQSGISVGSSAEPRLFDPRSSLSRQQMVSLLLRLMALETSALDLHPYYPLPDEAFVGQNEGSHGTVLKQSIRRVLTGQADVSFLVPKDDTARYTVQLFNDADARVAPGPDGFSFLPGQDGTAEPGQVAATIRLTSDASQTRLLAPGTRTATGIRHSSGFVALVIDGGGSHERVVAVLTREDGDALRVDTSGRPLPDEAYAVGPQMLFGAADAPAYTVQVALSGPGSDTCAETTLVSRPTDGPATPERALNALFAARTTPAEKAAGLTSFLPGADDLLISVRIKDGIAYVNPHEFQAYAPAAGTTCGTAAFLSKLQDTLAPFGAEGPVRVAVEGDPRTVEERFQFGCPDPVEPGDRCDPAPFLS